MEKRYQVFVSSPFADLSAARRNVIQTVMELDCIPAGMELFPAIDDEQWAFIKRVIDDCDYYVLLLGGRYGSMDDVGISFTEKEYEYAVSKKIKVLAFLHEDPVALRDVDDPEPDKVFEKLIAFRSRVAAGRLVRFWKDQAELPSLVALSLPKTIKTYPAVGWIRADQAATSDVLQELNQLRKEKEALQGELRALKAAARVDIRNLAGLDAVIKLSGTSRRAHNASPYQWECEMTLGEIFESIAPYLLEHPNDGSVKLQVKQAANATRTATPYYSTLDDQVFQTIKLQLTALKLVKVEYLKTVKGGMALFWTLTPRGRQLMFERRTIRTDDDPEENTASPELNMR